MTDKQIFVIQESPHPSRSRAIEAVKCAQVGYVVRISPATRNLDQSAKFHAICGDVAKQKEFAGKKRPLEAWKVLFISGHAVATKEGSEMVPGLESEFVNIRESSANMSVRRMASLIEYCLAWCAQNEITLSQKTKDQF